VGSEGAGVVLEVGPGVDDLARGDRVMGMFADAFGPVAVGDRRLLARMPEGWSFAQAASVPIAFLTAYYALVDLAELRAGQRLLVHAATGGVGMAAVQLARHLGAEVFATASPGKWGVLEGMGLGGADRVPARRVQEGFPGATEARCGRRLDCLSRDWWMLRWSCAGARGRFIEMGKTDIRIPPRWPGHEGVDYRAFDLMEAGPRHAWGARDCRLFERGALTLPPVRCWDVRRGPEAFQFMSQARPSARTCHDARPPGWRSGTGSSQSGTGGTALHRRHGRAGALLARHLVAGTVRSPTPLVGGRGRRGASAGARAGEDGRRCGCVRRGDREQAACCGGVPGAPAERADARRRDLDDFAL
jgi:hypothetical protein